MTNAAQYDRETIAVMQRVLRYDSIGVDGGAHRGDLLREMFRLAPAGRHHAFEPLPHLAHQLRVEFPRAFVHQAALGSASGEAPFVYVQNDPGYSGLRQRTYDRNDPSLEMIRVAVTRIDDLFRPEDEIAFVKLDLEGGEYDALVGGAATLKRCRPMVVFEAGSKSTSHYGVSARDLYQLVTRRLTLNVSTMERWLAARPQLDESAFLAHYDDDYYFIAYP